MKIEILTLFPKMFQGPFAESILRRAQDKSLVKIEIHNLRKWTKDKRKTVDDRPFGGGVGMVMRVDVIDRAVSSIKKQVLSIKKTRIILLSPAGKIFNQKIARRLAKEKHLIFICGHYEGVDERVREYLVDEEISIGDYVLTGGELPTMVVIDAIVRLIPGVLEKPEATKNESFSNSHLEYPQYTRPADFKNWKVPKILLSGDHKKIEDWRQKQALKITKQKRPDLIRKVST